MRNLKVFGIVMAVLAFVQAQDDQVQAEESQGQTSEDVGVPDVLGIVETDMKPAYDIEGLLKMLEEGFTVGTRSSRITILEGHNFNAMEEEIIEKQHKKDLYIMLDALIRASADVVDSTNR